MSGIAFRPSTAFLDTRRMVGGPLATVALAVKAALALDSTAAILVFEDQTGKVVDLDLRGSDAEIAALYKKRSAEFAATEKRDVEQLIGVVELDGEDD